MQDEFDGLRLKSDKELYEWVACWKPGTHKHFAGIEEIRRRQQAPANVASWCALVISVIALFAGLVK